jgi:hypothetical protein
MQQSGNLKSSAVRRSIQAGNRPGHPRFRTSVAWPALSGIVVLLLAGVALSVWSTATTPPEAGLNEVLGALLGASAAFFGCVIEADRRAFDLHPPAREDARAGIAFGAGIGFVLLLIAFGQTGQKVMDDEKLTALLVTGVAVQCACVPLLWSAAGRLQLFRDRVWLLGGFATASAVWGLAFNGDGPEPEMRLFTWNSLLVALALAIRLGLWGWLEFDSPRTDGAERRAA